MMNKTLPLLISLIFFFSSSVFGQWIERYYQCACEGGGLDSCSEIVEQNEPNFHAFLNYLSKHPQDSKEAITQLRSAQIILEQRKQIRNEDEGECLDFPLMVIKNATAFAGKELVSKAPGASVRILALRELSKAAYKWAETNCFNQSGPLRSPLLSSLPNPMFCRFK